MKKLFLVVLFLSLISFTACISIKISVNKNDDKNVVENSDDKSKTNLKNNYVLNEESKKNLINESKINLKLDKILLSDSNVFNDPNWKTFEFDVYLERPDLGLKEPINPGDLYSVDLPLELQPDLMYVTSLEDHDPGSGMLCDRPRFPHRCSVSLSKQELGNSEYSFLIKTTFEDGTYAEKIITVPYPKDLEKPELVEPISVPKQGDKLDLKFKDVGADSYDVSVNLCKPYDNDGINPCLDGVHYSLVRKNNELVSETDSDLEINVINEIVHLKSDFPIVFEESVEYSIVANLQGKIQDIPTYITTAEYKSF